MQAYRCWVHLADHEYAHSTRLPDGTRIETGPDGRPLYNMRTAAREVFDAHPDLDDLVVTVVEHGGWYLSFLRCGAVVESANGSAALSDPAAVAFFRRVKAGPVEWVYLPSVRRPGVEPGRYCDACGAKFKGSADQSFRHRVVGDDRTRYCCSVACLDTDRERLVALGWSALTA